MALDSNHRCDGCKDGLEDGQEVFCSSCYDKLKTECEKKGELIEDLNDDVEELNTEIEKLQEENEKLQEENEKLTWKKDCITKK